MFDFIINLLDLKEEDISIIDSITTLNSSDFYVLLKVLPHPCPRCGCFTSAIKDYYLRKLNHRILLHSHSTIYYKQRRYFCPHCRSSFIENNPFGNSRKKLTPATIVHILEDLKPYTSTYAQVAKRYNISPSTVIDIFDKHVQIKRKILPSILCMDEFYFNRHSKYKYAFMLMDFEKKVIVDILESRWQSKLSAYFFSIPLEERNRVHYICIDMYRPYKDIITIYFKNSICCIDSFHVIKKINDSLNTVRKTVLRRYKDNKKSQEYRLLKYRYKLLLVNGDKIDNQKFYKSNILQYHITQQGELEKILAIDSTLKKCYRMKEDYIEFNTIAENEYSKTKQEKELTELITRMLDTNIKILVDCAQTLNHWKPEILNSFVWIKGRRISNGPIEGKNTYIKKIISNANGLKNFERSRNKFLYSQNLYETYTISEYQKQIKEPGKKRGSYKKK